MNSSAVKNCKSTSSRETLCHVTISRPTPAIVIAPPPKVNLRKAHLSPAIHFPLSTPHNQLISTRNSADSFLSPPGISSSIQLTLLNVAPRHSRSPLLPIAPQQPSENAQITNNISLKLPQQLVARQKYSQRKKIFAEIDQKGKDEGEDKVGRKWIGGFVEVHTNNSAVEQFSFIRKGRQHEMPREGSNQLSIFEVREMGPWEL